jgi:multiple sugar transport system substrate-binding protein
MKLSRRQVAGGIGAASVAALGAVPAGAQQQVTLDVLYCLPSFARFHEPIAAEFMKKFPNIRIQFRAPATNYDEGHQAMLRAAVTNQLPDVYYSGYHLLSELMRTLVRRGQANDLGPMMDAEPAAWRNANYSDALLGLGKVDGKLWGLAFNASTPIVYINETLLKKAGGSVENFPTDWNGIIELATRIRKAQPDVAGMSYDVHNWPDDWLFRALILSQGGKLLNDAETEVAFGGPVGLRLMQMSRRFVSETGMELLDWEQSKQAFCAGKTGIYFHTPAVLRQVTDLIGGKFKLETAKFPIDDKANGGIPTGGNAAIILARDEAKKKAAWEFLKFVTGPDAQKIVVEMTGYMPTNVKSVEKEYLGPFYDANPNFRTVFSQIDRARPWQGYPGSNATRIWRQQRDVMNAVMRGELAPEAAIDRVVKETNALFK